jgi:hypothetical protein
MRGKMIFVLVDSSGKYGPMYRKMFPDLRNATFFVSQPGESRRATLPFAPHPQVRSMLCVQTMPSSRSTWSAWRRAGISSSPPGRFEPSRTLLIYRL